MNNSFKSYEFQYWLSSLTDEVLDEIIHMIIEECKTRRDQYKIEKDNYAADLELYTAKK